MNKRALVLTLAFLAATFQAFGDDVPRLSRRLLDLYLGDHMPVIQKLYPPTHDWEPVKQANVGVTRYQVERGDMTQPPPGVETMWLGLRHGKLVEIQVIYDDAATKEKPVQALVDQLSLIYGEPHRNESRFWWVDGSTVIRIFNAEVPVESDGQKAVSLRTSVQVMDVSLFKKDSDRPEAPAPKRDDSWIPKMY